MYKFSFHNHTTRCQHAQPDMSDDSLVQAHIAKGFTSMAFTDHCPWKTLIHPSGIRTRMLYSEKKEYIASIDMLKKKYAEEINIFSGYEMEYIPSLHEEMVQMRKEADLILLGQHHLYNYDTGSVQGFNYSQDHISEKDLLHYPVLIEQAAREGFPDIIAHPDIYLKNRLTFGDTEERIAHRIAQIAVQHHLPLEINLAHIAACMDGRMSKEHYPNADFWRVVSQYPVQVLFGIDCHWLFQLDLYEASIKRAQEIIGKKTMAALSFCTEEDIIRRRR